MARSVVYDGRDRFFDDLEFDNEATKEEFKKLVKLAERLARKLIGFYPKPRRNKLPPYSEIQKFYNRVIGEMVAFIKKAIIFERTDLKRVILLKRIYREKMKKLIKEFAELVEKYQKEYADPLFDSLNPIITKNPMAVPLELRMLYEWNIENIKALHNLWFMLHADEIVKELEDEEEDLELVSAFDTIENFFEKYRPVASSLIESFSSVIQRNFLDETAYLIVRDDHNRVINIGILLDEHYKLPRIDFDVIEKELFINGGRVDWPYEIRVWFKDEKHREKFPLLDVDDISIHHAYVPVRVRGVVGLLQPKYHRLWRVKVFDKDAEEGWSYRFALLPQKIYTGRGTKAKIIPSVDNIRIETQVGELQLFPEEIEKSRKASTSVKFVLEGSLVDKVLPGERYEFVAIPFYKDPAKDDEIYLYVVDVRKIDMFERFKITEEDIENFRKMKKRFEKELKEEADKLSEKMGFKIPPMIYAVLKSFAPDVRLTETSVMIKFAVLLPALKGALKGDVRNELHSLIIGEPSTGKTHIAEELTKVHPKALYVSGKSATGRGLTVSVAKDKLTGQWYASPGAIVLADGGVLIIDELDKANKEDRSNLYEALESRKVTVAKATVFKTMPARTSVIGIANPPSNVIKDITDIRALFKKAGFDPAFVSRFDIIVVALDITTYEDDIEDALSIIKRARGEKFDTPMTYDELRKYLTYAMTLEPEITDEVAIYLSKIYAEMREEARQSGNTTYMIKKRNLEGILRIATALAKLNLDDKVTKEHIDIAVAIFKYSQKIRREAEKEVKVSKRILTNQIINVILDKGITVADDRAFEEIADEVIERYNYDDSLRENILSAVSEVITKNLVKKKVVVFDDASGKWIIRLNTLRSYSNGEKPQPVKKEKPPAFLDKPREEQVRIVKREVEKAIVENKGFTTEDREAIFTAMVEKFGKISKSKIYELIDEAIQQLESEGKIELTNDGGQLKWRLKTPKGEKR